MSTSVQQEGHRELLVYACAGCLIHLLIIATACRTAESSLQEISSLHTELAANLEMQAEGISQLVADSFGITEDIDRGNKELKKASERGSVAQKVFYATVGFCTFLTMWDLIF
jgi:syntaxin 18